MTTLHITEAGSVQFPMVRHAQGIGWTPVPPKDALDMRGGEAGLLFPSELEGALRRFNPLDDERRLPRRRRTTRSAPADH